MVNTHMGRMKSVSFFISLLFFLIIIQLHIPKVLAQTPTPGVPTDDDVNAIARQLYCPVCENTPLDVCPTQACAEWRDLIREKLAEGWGEEQIKQYFVERFGESTLAVPPARGLNWLIYIVPLIIILTGFLIFYNTIRTWPTNELQGMEDTSAQDSSKTCVDYISRLEEELKKNY